MATVLVVDDNPLNLTLASEVLTRAGHEVHVVDGAEYALDLLAGFKVDVVLTDINMPGMSGKELARLLHERLGKNCPRLIAYTAYSLPHQKQSIVDAGFDAIVVKPARPEDMLAAIAGDEPDAGR